MSGTISKKSLIAGLAFCTLALATTAYAQAPVGGNNVIVDYSALPYGGPRAPYPYYPAQIPYPYPSAYPYAVPYAPAYAYPYPARQFYPAAGGIANNAVQYYPVQPYPYAGYPAAPYGYNPAYPNAPYSYVPYGVPPYPAAGYVAPIAGGQGVLKAPKNTFIPTPRPFNPDEALAEAPKRPRQIAQTAETEPVTESVPEASPTPDSPPPPSDVPDSVSPVLSPDAQQSQTSNETSETSPTSSESAEAPADASAGIDNNGENAPPSSPEAETGTASSDASTSTSPDQQASVEAAKQPETTAPSGSEIRIVYAPESDELPKEAEDQLKGLVAKMQEDESLRIQVLAYASGTQEAESKARRLSLARGLNVRAFLINAGIRSTRIEIRALGLKLPDSGPADRVDILPAAS